MTASLASRYDSTESVKCRENTSELLKVRGRRTTRPGLHNFNL